MIEELFGGLNGKGVSPVIAIVLLLMMTVAAAGAAYFWLTSMQSRMQKASYKSVEKVMESTGRRVIAQATLCKPTYPYKGLVGYWMMDEGSGDYANDSSGNGNDGTLYPGSDGSITSTSGMWTDGQIGKALEFDGNDSYVNVSSSSSFNVSKLTFTAWVYDDSSETWYETLFGQTNPAATIIDIKSNRHLRVHTTDASDTSSSGEIPLDEWTHVAVTWENGNVEFYLDGELDSTGTQTGTKFTGTDPIIMGGYIGNNWLGGKMDEVHIYNRVLSENEIKELYDAENHSARRRIDVTVRNIGSEKIPKAEWVANLKQDGTTVETDAYNASSIDTGELTTLKFYFKNFKPNTEYTIDLQGTGTSTTVSC